MSPSARPRWGPVAAACAAVGLFAVVAVAAPAVQAATPRPALPRLAKIVSTAHNSFTVQIAPTPHATKFRLFASTRRSSLYVANIKHARRSAARRSQQSTIRGLRYGSTPYYFRIEALNGARHRWGTTIYHISLRPRTPAGLRATATGAGTYLTWHAQPATGWQITQATRRSFAGPIRSYRIRGANTTFTPYGLVKGRTYWFRVRALNGSTLGPPSRTVSAKPRTALHLIRVATYNVLEANTAGVVEGNGPLAPWSQRRAGVVASIRSSHADVVAIQEAAAWIGTPAGYGGIRQIDDLRSALGGVWALAVTETPPTRHGYRRTANYVLYRSSEYTPDSAGGHWALGDNHWAAYQLLRNRASGARITVVSPHLAAGKGKPYDTVRRDEARRLLADGAAYAKTTGAPIVYAGDFNSTVNRNHVFDGPGLVMRAAGVADSADAAQRSVNSRYNSANRNLRAPPAFGQSIDHIYAPPGVAVVSRTLVIRLVHGRFAGVIPSDHNLVLAQLAFPY